MSKSSWEQRRPHERMTVGPSGPPAGVGCFFFVSETAAVMGVASGASLWLRSGQMPQDSPLCASLSSSVKWDDSGTHVRIFQ